VGAPGRVCCVGSFQGQGNCVRGQGQEYCVRGQGQEYCVSGVLAVWEGSVSGWALGSGLWTLDSGAWGCQVLLVPGVARSCWCLLLRLL
jgi:hypothetical protein